MWIWTLAEQLLQDLPYALRAMMKNRGFTTLTVLTMALGIGANTAIYSFMDSYSAALSSGRRSPIPCGAQLAQ